MKGIEKVLSISSPALALNPPFLAGNSKRIDEIRHLLACRNGFFAFESALHVFPSVERPVIRYRDLAAWNEYSLWKFKYGETTGSLLCFAEDVFGRQYCVESGKDLIAVFDPETAEIEPVAEDMEGFLDLIYREYELYTGHDLAHSWQAKHGSLDPTHRLVPIIPFCLGGEFHIENLQSLRAEIGMQLRADIYNQIKDLPEGTTVELKVVP